MAARYGSSNRKTCGSADAATAQQDTAIKSSLGRIKNKILVMSGKGGVGKSTVSANFALGLAKRGYRVGLMDVDIHGPDICRMLKLKDKLHEQKRNRGSLLPPMKVGDNLKVISLEYMMKDTDDPIIWRGPLKVQAIRQFISDIDWGDLDYLIIDAPPGTGDEPLTVAQNIKDTRALIVTTPQNIALADVRKSLNFCKHVEIKILGIVENMSGFICPRCHERVDIFKTGGGEKTALDFGLKFLGRIPVDPLVVEAGDSGTPYLSSDKDSPSTKAFSEVITNVEKEMASSPLPFPDSAESPCASCKISGNCGPKP
ncbi:MAG: P-loop NTPase [Thermodesulfobacteriota bacterium]